MKPRERRESGEQDLFRSRLDAIIDMKHALVKLARAMDWRSLEGEFDIRMGRRVPSSSCSVQTTIRTAAATPNSNRWF